MNLISRVSSSDHHKHRMAPPRSLFFHLFLSAILMLASVTLTRGGEPTAEEQTRGRPNIVFIMADDMGFNDVGYHNRRDVITPNIDKLAGEGVRLENYYVEPICSPTRGQFMSGRSQIHTGLQHKNIQRTQPNALPLDSPTMADKLKEAGYSTDMVGKWHLGFYHQKYLPTSRGFDTFYGMYLGSGGHFTHRACINGRCILDLHNDTTCKQEPDFGQSKVYSTHLFTDEATRIIEQRAQQENPFFLYLAYQAVHGPLQVPSKYQRMLDQKLGRRIGNSKRRKYLSMALAMDIGVGKVVAALKKQGVWNNTVLVFSTDNGATGKHGGSNSPLKGQKGTYYEGGVRAVGFVNSPLLKRRGYINTELMHVTDWYPTFVALAKGNTNGTHNLAGFDQWKSLSLGAPSPREEILFNIDPSSRSQVKNIYRHKYDTRMLGALRKGDFKVITGIDESPGFSLFNVKEDPTESNDLSQVEGYKPKVKELFDTLQAYQKTAVPVRFPPTDRVSFGDSLKPWHK